ncbi:MAG TPA: hypothetical protein VIT67_03110, partial [Povalibacter sp.]
EGRPAMSATPGESGYLGFGPYIVLPAGRYAVTFDVRGGGSAVEGLDVGRVDVVSDGGVATIAAGPIHSGTNAGVRLEFELERPARAVEFRTFVDGRADVRLLGVSLEPLQSAK